MNLNKAFILGNVTRDPEKRNLPSGQMVASFGIATNRYFTKDNEKKSEAEFHNITTFGRLAEIASQYLKKGSLVLIEGRIRTSNWQDKEGVKHYRTEIIAQSLQLGPRTGAGGTSSYQAPAETDSEPSHLSAPAKPTAKIKEEEIPVIDIDDSKMDNDDEIDVKDIPF